MFFTSLTFLVQSVEVSFRAKKKFSLSIKVYMTLPPDELTCPAQLSLRLARYNWKGSSCSRQSRLAWRRLSDLVLSYVTLLHINCERAATGSGVALAGSKIHIHTAEY